MGLLLLCVFTASGQDESEWILGGQTSFSLGASEEDQIFVDKASVLVLAQVCNWAFQAEAGLDGAAFNSLTLGANGPLGPAGISSSLALNPDEAAFTSWTTSVSFDVLGTTATGLLFLTDPQTSSYLQTEISGGAECIQVRISSKFGVSPLCFWSTQANAAWTIAPCDLNVALSTGFADPSGFAGFDVVITGIPLFAEPVFGLSGSMDVAARFAEEEKVVTPTLRMALDWIACPELGLLGEIVFDQSIPRLDGISVYGLVGELAFENGITLFIRESFLEEKDSTVIGTAGFFESLSIVGPIAGCCDGAGEFELEVLFVRDNSSTGTLFNWGRTTLQVEVPIFDGLTLYADVRFQPQAIDPSWEVKTGFDLLW